MAVAILKRKRKAAQLQRNHGGLHSCSLILLSPTLLSYEIVAHKFGLSKHSHLHHHISLLGCHFGARRFAVPQLPFAAHIKRLDKNVLYAAEIPVDGSSTVENSEGVREAVDRLSAELAMPIMAILDEIRNAYTRINRPMILNRQILDLDARVSRFISRRLRYANSHWLFHAVGTDNQQRKLENELQYDIQIPHSLYWIEILRSTGGVPPAITGLWAIVRHVGADESSVVQGSEYAVTAVAIPSDGSRIASGSREKKIRLRNADTTAASRTLRLGASNCISPDNSRLVPGSTNRTLRLWGLDNGQLLGGPLVGHGGWVTAVVFLPDGARVVSGSWNGKVGIWDAYIGKLLRESLECYKTSVMMVAFSPDGSRVFSVSLSKTIHIWDAYTIEPLGELLCGHDYWVSDVAFSPDNLRMASGSTDSTIRIRDAATIQPLGGPLLGHQSSLCAVAISSDGSRTVSGSKVTTIGRPVGQPLLGHTGEVIAVAFSPEGSRIVSGSGGCDYSNMECREW
ncbi:related to WD40-repeat protein (notchless protein) [Serendipita indica DSM 11827]|uniref:Related to WD40-repeat protein (Notchless protein) n=1 Tax=Serendipita indica (strain DSM 11827) TaxID=1109443 RepID=G4THX1_SERID|nr:related to WD40-repeat protein (notchless protein) [Serendipita indica DSM 11827]